MRLPLKGSLSPWMTAFLVDSKTSCSAAPGRAAYKRDGVVQTMAKSAARQVTNQIVRGMLGSLLGGRRR